MYITTPSSTLQQARHETSGTHLNSNSMRSDKPAKVSQTVSFVPPPLATKPGAQSTFVAAPPLTDNKLARRSYTQLQALVPPLEKLHIPAEKLTP